jgi:hypothetical protein
MRKTILPASAAVLLLGCPAATPGANEPTGDATAVLVSYRHSMTMQPGTGGTSSSTTVHEDGAVEREAATEHASAGLRCPPLPAPKLAELRALVQAARDAGLQPADTTSTLPTPNANYSVSLWFVLGGGIEQEIQVAGFADMPPELSALAAWLDAHVGECATDTTDPTDLPDDGAALADAACLVSDPADIYRSTRLCLAREQGRFTLSVSETVPDATISKVFEGAIVPAPEGLVLRSEQVSGRTVNEQLGTTSQGAEGAAQLEWLLQEQPDGTFALESPEGAPTVLQQE